MNKDMLDMAITVGSGVAELLPTHRQCSIEITNESSKFTLSNPATYIGSGSCTEPLPPQLEQSSQGKALFSKSAHAARGACGVFTYDIVDKSTKECAEKMAVMFSVPYDFNLYSNWYAVGIFEKSRACDHGLFYQMYNNSQEGFTRGKASGPGLTHKNDRVAVMAVMADSYQPVMKMQVKDV